MRKLHPVGPHEVLVAAGRLRRPDGAVEDWTRHQLPGDRQVVRLEVAGAELWHLAMDGRGYPERLEARLLGAGRQVDVTYTFFEDEVLVWCRGAEPASAAIAVPPGYRLLWPPVAGRLECLGGAAAPGATGAVTCLALARRAAGPGGLLAEVVDVTVTSSPRGLALRAPGRPAMSADLDAEGALAAWREGDAAWVAWNAAEYGDAGAPASGSGE